ncbi:hypothetical protein B0T09DRAFT_338219 [Sordaria sp. MPI-SDFR-AT-0083]|nr:hypothetical protein B0T09DRAFT_338219 [Sordaria sp. MPI-SDFR-AT-0083]
MFPRGLQLSQPFSRSRVRLPTARSLTTPSIAFSTSAIRCGGRRLKDKTSTAITNKNTDLAYKHARDAIRGPRSTHRKTSDKGSQKPESRPTARFVESERPLVRRVTSGPKPNHEVVDQERNTEGQKKKSEEYRLGPVVISPPPGRLEFEQQLGPVVIYPPSGRQEFEQQEPRPIDRTARSSPENTTALPEIPELQAHPGTVRIIRHLAQDPLEKPRVRRVPFGVGEKEKHQLQARPAARPVNGRKEDFLGKRAVDSRSGSASAIKPAWATSPSENLQRKRRSAEARAANKDTETGLEEAFPSADELQAWFKEFTSERSNPEATTAQSAPLEPPKMRVKKTYEHDKVDSEEELRRLEETGFSGPTKMDPRRGTVFRQPKEELDTLVSSVNVAEKKAVEQSKEDGGPAIVVLNSVSRSLLESDFRHIAGHGQHVDGWTYGLVKVVQSRSRTTHEPQGCYFLFFDNELNARAYVDVLERLHNKSRQALPKEWRQKATGTPTPAQPAKKPEGSEGVEESVDELPDVDEQQEDGPGSLGRKWREDDGLDAARYTLLPPTAPLHCQIFTRDNIVEFENIREASKGLRPQQLLSKPKFARSGKASFVAPPPKGLVDYAEDPEIEHSRSSVLVYLVGTKMTVRGLRTAIEIDAEARNYPWQLLQEEEVPAAMTTRATKTETEKDERDPAIKPILSTLSTIKFSKFNEHRIEHELDEFSGGQMKEGEMHGFSRFVVSFADVSEARRFVRTWHKREMLDPRTERTVIVNVTSLW